MLIASKNFVRALLMLLIFVTILMPSVDIANAQPYFFKINIVCGAVSVPTLEYMQTYWRQIGIDTSIVTMEWTPMIELVSGTNKTYDEGGWDMMSSRMNTGTIPDPDQSMNFYSTGSSAFMRWKDTRSDDLLEQGLQEMDIEKRREIYWDWQKIIYDELPAILLFTDDRPEIFSTNVQGAEEAVSWIYISEPAWKSIWLTIPGVDTFVTADKWIPADFLPHLVGGWLGGETVSAPLMWAYPNGTVLPELATSYEWTDGGKTLTVQLRDDVIWSDGTQFTSRDVVFTFDVILNPDSEARLHSTVKNEIESVEALGNYTAIFHLKEANSAFIARLSSKNLAMLPWHILKDISVAEMKNSDANLVPGVLPSLGPYKIVEKQTGEWIKFESNTLWYGWGKFGRPTTPPFQYMFWKYIAEKTTVLAAIETGEVHWANGAYTFQENMADIMSKTDKYKWATAPTWVAYPHALVPNLDHPILSNKWVRKAMSYAIPREDYVDKVMNGLGTATNLPYYPGTYWYNSEISPDPYPFDLTKAKECMEEAGYRYAWLEAPETPYLEFVAFLLIGVVGGTGIGIVVSRRWLHK